MTLLNLMKVLKKTELEQVLHYYKETYWLIIMRNRTLPFQRFFCRGPCCFLQILYRYPAVYLLALALRRQPEICVLRGIFLLVPDDTSYNDRTLQTMRYNNQTVNTPTACL